MKSIIYCVTETEVDIDARCVRYVYNYFLDSSEAIDFSNKEEKSEYYIVTKDNVELVKSPSTKLVNLIATNKTYTSNNRLH